MIVKYLSKFVLEVLPSVVATIIGAYIVNHYIAAKPAADTPVAASVSTVDPKKADAKGLDVKGLDVKGVGTPAEQASLPEPGQVQKNTSEKATADRTIPDKAAPQKVVVEKAAAEKAAADKPTETASLPAEARRRPWALREKTVAKTALPTAATANVAAPVEAGPSQEDRRDANDMARAAIERLRGSGEPSRPPEVPHAADSSRVVSAPAAQPVQPLPPAITVATPSGKSKPPYVPVVRVEDPQRPTPPADIPTASIPTTSRPLDLHAEAATPGRTTVADDMLSAAKSVFHAVLPR